MMNTKLVSITQRFFFAVIVAGMLAGCIMMKMSKPAVSVSPVPGVGIGCYKISNIKISNMGLNSKPTACQYMNIDLDSIRTECNATSDESTNHVSVSVWIHRMSCSTMGFFTGVEALLSGCTLLILPMYEPSIFEYELLIVDDKTSELLGRTHTGFDRWHCVSLLPIPWLVKTSSTDYYWMGYLGKPRGGDGNQYYWVKALGEYEKLVLKDAIVDCLSSAEMQRKPEELKRAKAQQEMERIAKNKERMAKEEERRRAAESAAKEAEKQRIARGVSAEDFFGIPLRADVSKEMREIGVFSEVTGLAGALRYYLGQEGYSFSRELKGSRKFDGFRICSVFTDGETNGVVGLSAVEKDLAVGRDAMVKRAQHHIDAITKMLNYKEAPLHEGSATEHSWEWFAQTTNGPSFFVRLCAVAKGTTQTLWAFSITLSESKWQASLWDLDESSPRRSKDKFAISTGTGWFVQTNILVTCEHVVRGARDIKLVDLDGNECCAKVVAKSEVSDIALLRVENYIALSVLPIKSNLERMSTHVFTIGYPLSDLLGSSQKYTDGVISSITGLVGDKTCYQISVPLQPGNSGGALINDAGEVVGVTSSVLNALFTAKFKGTIPQNVNYAVKSRYVIELLEDNGITWQSAHTGGKDIERISKATVLLKVQK